MEPRMKYRKQEKRSFDLTDYEMSASQNNFKESYKLSKMIFILQLRFKQL